MIVKKNHFRQKSQENLFVGKIYRRKMYTEGKLISAERFEHLILLIIGEHHCVVINFLCN